jgi:hypothetical protein
LNKVIIGFSMRAQPQAPELRAPATRLQLDEGLAGWAAEAEATLGPGGAQAA